MTKKTLHTKQNRRGGLAASAILFALAALSLAALACEFSQAGAVLSAPTRAPTIAAPTPSPTATPIICTVHADALYLRAGPGMEYQALDALDKGEPVTLQTTASEHWQLVTVGARTGWVNSLFLDCGK